MSTSSAPLLTAILLSKILTSSKLCELGNTPETTAIFTFFEVNLFLTVSAKFG